MAVLSLQTEVTKTSAFTGAAVDISTLAAPLEFSLVVDSLTPTGATAIFQLQTSNDGTPFTSDTRVEKAISVLGPAGTPPVPQEYAFREYDMAGFRNGVTNGHARLVLSYLDAGPLSVSKPGTVTPTPSTSGGTLAAATYFYKVTAVGNGGETLPSAEASATTTGSTSSIALAWAAVTGATSYKIYRGTATNTETVFYTSNTNSFTDINGTSAAGTPPVVNSTGAPSVSYSAAFKY